jgi:hypothetical protein
MSSALMLAVLTLCHLENASTSQNQCNSIELWDGNRAVGLNWCCAQNEVCTACPTSCGDVEEMCRIPQN